jgi:hypothetical protein
MTDLTASSVPAEGSARGSIWSQRTLAAATVLLLLIALGDYFFLNFRPGVSVAIFFIAITVGVLALHADRLREARTLILATVAVLGALPSIEAVTVWGFLWSLGGVSLLSIGISGNLPRYEDWVGTFMRFGILAPVRLTADSFRLLIEAGQQKIGGRIVRGALVWIVPVIFTAIFVWLFAAANPLLEAGLRAIRLDKLFEWLTPGRIIVWSFIATLCWPLLSPQLLRWMPAPQAQGPVQAKPESLVFGTIAIRNSLIVFNAMFAVQTVMDLMFLWGGVRLPDGMTHADYAHRGAYPLIVTALLAAAFVLGAMHKNGPGEKSKLVRDLIYLWIAQNIWLVISSILRLDLYVESYGLSELRLAAGIWMALVAIGLGLIMVRIAARRSNKWLIMANLTSLALTLYALSWIDTQYLVARYNILHSREMTGEGIALDYSYIDELGPAAIPAIDEFLAKAKFADQDTINTISIARGHILERLPLEHAWPTWTWREDRLLRYLGKQPYGRDWCAIDTDACPRS